MKQTIGTQKIVEEEGEKGMVSLLGAVYKKGFS